MAKTAKRAKTPKTAKTYKTIKFVIYCFEKSKPGKEEGTVQMTDARHRLVEGRPFGHFDSYDEIGSFVRQSMTERVSAAR